MYLFHKILGGMSNSVDHDQTPSGAVCSASVLFAYATKFAVTKVGESELLRKSI